MIDWIKLPQFACLRHVGNINFHISWNPFTSAPEALADHVCTSLSVSTGDWGLLITYHLFVGDWGLLISLADHVCTSLRVSTGDWGLLICPTAHFTPRTGKPKTRLCEWGPILYKKTGTVLYNKKNRHNFVQKTGAICTRRIPLISNTPRHSAMCHIVHLRTMTQLGWGNSLGSKQLKVGTEHYKVQHKAQAVVILTLRRASIIRQTFWI